MATCKHCGDKAPMGNTECNDCHYARSEDRALAQAQRQADAAAAAFALEERLKSMPLSNTPSLPGHQILGLAGVVTAEAAFGMNIFKDAATSLSDTFGGRSRTLETSLSGARTACLEDLKRAAEEMGASAIVGIQLDADIITPGRSSSKMVMVTGTGTAVVAVPDEAIAHGTGFPAPPSRVAEGA